MVNTPQEIERRKRLKKKRARTRFREILRQISAAQSGGGGGGTPIGGGGQLDFTSPNNSGLIALFMEF